MGRAVGDVDDVAFEVDGPGADGGLSGDLRGDVYLGGGEEVFVLIGEPGADAEACVKGGIGRSGERVWCDGFVVPGALGADADGPALDEGAGHIVLVS